MTQETAWLDYTNEPPGYDVWVSMGNSGWQTGGARVADNIADAWSHYKREHDPPGMLVIPRDNARAAAWAWHDLRRAIAYDIYSRTCGGKALTVLMAAALTWTDAECAEVEAYAALPFPRSVDMPAPLQRVLLPEGERTC
jgi:hypothetical protein